MGSLSDFIHRQQTLVAGDQHLRSIDQLLCIHFALPYFQLRIRD
jgi:hypothetical protein